MARVAYGAAGVDVHSQLEADDLRDRGQLDDIGRRSAALDATDDRLRNSGQPSNGFLAETRSAPGQPKGAPDIHPKAHPVLPAAFGATLQCGHEGDDGPRVLTGRLRLGYS
ncbi:MAG: hypothetical protein ACRDGJ_05950 [Candidatus Limnocylindria bacterium]